MSHALIRQMDSYVVMEPGCQERILSSEELLSWLVGHLASLSALPDDLSSRPDALSRACYLRDTACELELQPGCRISWFAVRLESPFEDRPTA